MSNWYGYNVFSSYNTKHLMKLLFGQHSKLLPKLYVPENLDFLVSAINLPKSLFFGSYVNIIEKMSIYPLYTIFMSDEDSNEYEVFRKENSYKAIEHKFRIRKYSYHEGKPKIKFCKYCIQENEYKFLNREHQVQGNAICYKHNAILQFVIYKADKSYSLNIDFIKLCNESDYCISEDDVYLDKRKQVAETVHNIFTNKIKDSRVAIKSKLRKRLRELGYMKYNYFNDIGKFWSDFKSYNLMNITDKQLYCIIYTTSVEEPPLAYISLILFLFHNLAYFDKYILLPEELVNIQYSYRGYEHLYKSQFGERMIEEYNLYLKKDHGNKYKVISIEDDMLVIKHKLCGEIISYPKKGFKWVNSCQLCHEIEINNKYKRRVAQIDNNYKYLEVNVKNQLLKLIHLRCNKEIIMHYNYFFNGQRCISCRKLDQYRNKIKDLFGDEYLVLDNKSCTEKATYIHNIPSCMGEISQTHKQFIKSKYCPCCHNAKTYKTIIK